MKKMLLLLLTALMALTLTACRRGPFAPVAPEKPVLYLYPEVETKVDVTLEVDGTLTCTYPAYENGWSVTAAPDGTLRDSSGQVYRYLYWEAEQQADFDFSRGFCVAGADTAAFLEEVLAQIGLNRAEANEFIIYWLPQMEQNPYNLIAFQGEAYTVGAQLRIDPAPESLLRVFMAWKPLSAPVTVEPQTFVPFVRSGFTAVEWGGAQIQ